MRRRRIKRASTHGAWGVRRASGPDGAQHPGDQGHRRLAHLSRRPLSGRGRRQRRLDLRHRLRAAARRRPASEGRGPHLHRPPDAQRASRPHGGVGGLLRAALQFPRDPLLRHRGQADRPEEQGDDEPLRQDPHPDQRELGRQEPDPGIPRRVPAARASSTSRSAPATSTRRSTRCGAPASQFQDTPDTYYEALDDAPAGPRRGRRAAQGGTASCSTARPRKARCCCRSSRRP